MMKKLSGFTLIELMVVIVILGILVGIGIPTSRRFLPRARLRGANQALTSDLMLARQKALSENAPYVVRLRYPDTTSYTVFCDNGAGGGIAGDRRQNGTEWGKVVKLPNGIIFSRPANPFDTLAFQANGMATSATTIWLKSSQTNDSLAVQLLLSGLVRL